MKTYIVRVNGKEYEVEVELKNEVSSGNGAGAVKQAPKAPEVETAGGIEITAGTAGKIWKITSSKGQTVKKGDSIMILEAMKMEIPVAAPQDGTVADILVAEGESIEAGCAVAIMK